MRDDFSEATKQILARRVSYHCSNPECHRLTSGPSEDPTKAVNLGVAAHITAASKGGPRYDASLSSSQRRHADNGIWLCQDCAKLIDSDPVRYPVAMLHEWKQTSEQAVREAIEIGGPLGRAEELEDYLDEAVSAYRDRLFQAVAPGPPDEPYRLLRAFEVEDARVFFGRDEAIDDLYAAICRDRLTVLHAPSGAGKTSLLKAGLSPRLIREGRLPVYVRISGDPLEAIKRAITSYSRDSWPSHLHEMALHDFLRLVCAQLGARTQELVLILDQFEDYYLFGPKREYRQLFIESLADCHDDGGLPVRFVISLRKDYHADLAEFGKRIPTIFHNEYVLEPMSRKEAQAAITGPVDRLRRPVTYEQGLLDRLLDDLESGGMELPHLQIICAQLYKTLPDSETIITLSRYQEELGGAEEILGNYLNDALRRFKKDERSIATEVLKELTISESGGQMLEHGILAARITDEEGVLDDVLSRLVDERLLRRTGDLGEAEYELAHAYLAKEIYPWIDRDGREAREAQMLMQRELSSWREQKVPVSKERLEILRGHVGVLDLNLKPEAQQMLLESALARRQDVGFWTRQVRDGQWDEDRMAAALAKQGIRGVKTAIDFKAKLTGDLREQVASALWRIYAGAEKLRHKWHAAWPLGVFIRWLPSTRERLQVGAVLGLSAAAVLLVLVLVGGAVWQVWPYLAREKAVAGRWVRVPEGDFIMGADEGQAKRVLKESESLQKVWLPTFDIMDNEVTQAQYKQCVDAGVCPTSAPENWAYGAGAKTEVSDLNKPMGNISWFDAMTFCQDWLRGRLPTAEEWEKAARGPEGKYYPWGNEWDASKANLDHEEAKGALPIDAEEMSGDIISDYQIKNLAGNVREWTATGYEMGRTGERIPHQVLPREIKEDGVNYVMAILHGGAWATPHYRGMGSVRGEYATLSIEEGKPRLPKAPEIGFRCVCPVEADCRTPWSPLWVLFGDY